MSAAPIHLVCGNCGLDRTAAMNAAGAIGPCRCGATRVVTEALVGTPAPLGFGTGAGVYGPRKPAA